jgi:uncharacterized protein (TIGR00299 family) protein
MTTIAWFSCASGIAGDMALGALLDAGAPLEAVQEQLARLPVAISLTAESVTRGGLAATKAHVVAPEDQPHRGLAEVLAIVEAATLAPRVDARVRAVFARLAESEARRHDIDVQSVHFHEVGAADAIADVVGVCVALELLGVDEIGSGPVALGTGTVNTEHGVLPNPAPAVVDLLRGRPVVGLDDPTELTTPTGAALLAALGTRFGAMPALTITSMGYGAGTRDRPGRPNVTGVVIGQIADDPSVEETVVELATNLDDITGELAAHVVARLLDEGALDAWLTPIIMKKGRPALTLSALARPAEVDRLRGLIVTETGTLGVRAQTLQRWTARRSVVEVDVYGHRVRVKRSEAGRKAEYDDVARAAAALGRPLRDVAFAAEAAADRMQ